MPADPGDTLQYRRAIGKSLGAGPFSPFGSSYYAFDRPPLTALVASRGLPCDCLWLGHGRGATRAISLAPTMMRCIARSVGACRHMVGQGRHFLGQQQHHLRYSMASDAGGATARRASMALIRHSLSIASKPRSRGGVSLFENGQEASESLRTWRSQHLSGFCACRRFRSL